MHEVPTLLDTYTMGIRAYNKYIYIRIIVIQYYVGIVLLAITKQIISSMLRNHIVSKREFCHNFSS